MVHWDKHNNSPEDYPIVNCDRKTMNLCVEMIRYKPLPLEDATRALACC
jgi:calcineurin-like phosphoesterase family protein